MQKSKIPNSLQAKKLKSHKLQAIRGFTLVEMLVSISVFMIVMLVAAGSILSIINANSKAQSIKSVMNNLNFVIENMAKNIRVGTDYKCYPSGSLTCTGGENGIEFTSYKDSDGVGGNDVVIYRYKENDTINHTGSIQRCMEINGIICPTTIDNDSNFSALTAPEVKISKMLFYVVNPGVPRVLITIKGYAGTKESARTYFNLQTTVSQRAF